MKLFITATDTGVGKTHISVSLLNQLKQSGFKTIGLKPVAAGCEDVAGNLRNSDALALQVAANVYLDYDVINPFRFAKPIAPHLAALSENNFLTVSQLSEKMHFGLSHPADIHIIEGVGGWFVPLNAHETMADYVIQENFSVLLVVGMRLGCLNHAILTYEAIKQSQLPFVGWVANCIEPAMQECIANIETLEKWFDVPCLARVAYQES